jgi:hypothetical protein
VLTALSIPALADPGTEIGNKIGWNNPNNPHHSAPALDFRSSQSAMASIG